MEVGEAVGARVEEEERLDETVVAVAAHVVGAAAGGAHVVVGEAGEGVHVAEEEEGKMNEGVVVVVVGGRGGKVVKGRRGS